MLLTDLQAGFDGDPAAKSKEEIISLILDFMQFMYIDLHMSSIVRKCHLSRESCQSMRMVIPELISTRVPRSENILY